jgi:hypothetical protein
MIKFWTTAENHQINIWANWRGNQETLAILRYTRQRQTNQTQTMSNTDPTKNIWQVFFIIIIIKKQCQWMKLKSGWWTEKKRKCTDRQTSVTYIALHHHTSGLQTYISFWICSFQVKLEKKKLKIVHISY